MLKCSILLIGILLPIVFAEDRNPFFRTDYMYSSEFRSFFKVHWDPNASFWDYAFNVCASEGAKLFYPRNNKEVSFASLMINVEAQDNQKEMFIGVHDELKVGEFVTVDGHRIELLGLKNQTKWLTSNTTKQCLLLNSNSQTFRIDRCCFPSNTSFPFICRKDMEEPCPNIDRNYKYVKALNKCYKVNDRATTWSMAMKQCFAEGGWLADLSHKFQIDEIRELISSDVTYFIGFHIMFQLKYRSEHPLISGHGYYSEKGHPYSSQYFNSWISMRKYEGERPCGVMRRNTQTSVEFQAENCNKKLPFICEMDLGPLNTIQY